MPLPRASPHDLPGSAWPFQVGAPRLAPHRHAELEANLVLTGRCTNVIDGRRVDLGPGDLLWLHPYDRHALVDASPACRFAILVFAPTLLSSELPSGHPLRARRGPGEPVRRLAVDRVNALAGLAREVQRETERRRSGPRPAGGDPLAAGLAWWLHQAWEAWLNGSERTARSLGPLVTRAIDAWQRDPALSLTACAREVGCSAAHLRRLMAQELGLGVTAWRNRVRLQSFISRMATDQTPNLMHACLAAGFGSYAQFHRVFTGQFSVSPSQWLARRPQAKPPSRTLP